jgi:hypothetical protein
MSDQRYPLALLLEYLPSSIFLSVITRPPEFDAHRKAINMIADCHYAEIIFNHTLHAKMYVATFGRGRKKLALLSSANLTSRGNTQREIGALFFWDPYSKRIINDIEREVYIVRRLSEGRRIKKRGEILEMDIS